MNNKNELIAMLEELDVPDEDIQSMVHELESLSVENEGITVEPINSQESLRQAILNEPDWRKRASMAARILSRDLD